MVWPGHGRKPVGRSGGRARGAHRGASEFIGRYKPLCRVRQNMEALGAQTRGEGRMGRGRAWSRRAGAGAETVPRPGPRPSLRCRRPALSSQVLGGGRGRAERSLLLGGVGRGRVSGARLRMKPRPKVVPRSLDGAQLLQQPLAFEKQPLFLSRGHAPASPGTTCTHRRRRRPRVELGCGGRRSPGRACPLRRHLVGTV